MMRAIMIASLLACGQAAVRNEQLRRQVGECAEVADTETFTQGQITGQLPSTAVVQAETDFVSADLIEIQYFTNYKVLSEKKSKELYVLSQCGTTPPTDADLSAVKAAHADYTVKRFTIPLQVVSSSSTVHLAFLKALGLQDRVKYVSEYATGPCWQKALGCGGKLESSVVQMSEVDAHFMDCSWDGTCTNVNGEAKGVHFSPSQEPGPLRSAEHIKFIAAFFNKEAEASQLFSSTMAAYESAAISMTPKPVVAWITYNAKSQWGDASFQLSQATYKLKMVTVAGGANVDGAAVQTTVGSKMTMADAATGKTYTVKEKDFSSKAEAATAFFSGLGQVDVVVDETYAVDPKVYTFETFKTTFSLTDASTLKFMTGKKVLRIDGTISENNGLDWFESRLAHPDWAVEGLAREMHGDVSKRFKYFRNIAVGQEPEVLTKAMCTSNLPSCDASEYPAPIGMMVAAVAGNTVAQHAGWALLLMIAGLLA